MCSSDLFFAALFAVTYLIAVLMSNKGENLRLGDKEFLVGRVDIAAARIAKYGPLLYADLKGTAGEQAIVVDHDPKQADTEGWTVYFAYPASRGPSCLVSVNQATQALQDCDGKPITVADLQQGIGHHPAASVDRVVLDMLAPWECIAAIATALRPGGVLMAYVATTTQMSRFVEDVRLDKRWTDPQAQELIARPWHVEGLAVRPNHRMQGHTGFLIQARRLADGTVLPVRRLRPAKGLVADTVGSREEVDDD